MEGWWVYSCCFVWCCFQDLFETAPSIFVLFPSRPSKSDEQDMLITAGGISVILQTGAVVELRRSQALRTCEHINCHKPLGTWVWRSKMSWASLVRAEWPVEFKRDFNIITRELSRAALLFSLVIIELSNWSIKSLYKKARLRDFGSSRQISIQIQQRSMTPRHMSYPACQQFDWYESINKPTITTLPSSPRRGRRKNAIEQTFNYSLQ